jgi:DnaD/phage-associated family protein
MKFKGFPAHQVPLTPIPEPFFSELLGIIDDLSELKLVLYAFWRLEHKTGDFRYLRRSEFLQDQMFMNSLSTDPEQSTPALDQAVERAVSHQVLLAAQNPQDADGETWYFLNSARGRAAVKAIQNGQWRPQYDEAPPATLIPERPNIFRLYEENIGPLTPMIAEALGEAEDEYPASWIEEAFRIAIQRNARNWRYIEAILKRWQEEGRDAREDRRDAEETGKKYIEGELSDYIKH